MEPYRALNRVSRKCSSSSGSYCKIRGDIGAGRARVGRTQDNSYGSTKQQYHIIFFRASADKHTTPSTKKDMRVNTNTIKSTASKTHR